MKKSSYQKLKDKNEALEAKIHRLLNDPDFLIKETIGNAMMNRMVKQLAKQIWNGSF